MTKGELIEIIARREGFNLKRAEIVVNTIFQAMTDALRDEERVEIRGFGSFEVRHYAAYRGRNPKTGEEVFVAAKRAPFFKTGKELRERVNGETPSDD
ncbi:MAG: integration host factor subunit beta [Bradymonadia bacterium]|jgi:integration host factor subunit beta